MEVKEQFHNDTYPRRIERYYLLLMNSKFICVNGICGDVEQGPWAAEKTFCNQLIAPV